MSNTNPIKVIIDPAKVILDLPEGKSNSVLEAVKFAAGYQAEIGKLRLKNRAGKALNADSVAQMGVIEQYKNKIWFAPKPSEGATYFYVCITDENCNFGNDNFTGEHADAAYFVKKGSKVTAVFICSGGLFGLKSLKKCLDSGGSRYQIRIVQYMQLMVGEVFIYKMPAAISHFKMAAILKFKEWLEPLPFEPKDCGAKVLDVNLMPSRLFYSCMALAHSSGKTVDYIWASTMCILGAFLSSKIRVSTDEHQTKPFASVIWAVLVGAPGAGKTPSINTLLERMQGYFIDPSETSISPSNTRALKALEQTKNQVVVKQIKECHKQGSNINLQKINKSVDDSFVIEEVVKKVGFKKLVLATDVTLAGLYKLLDSELGPVLYVADELKSLLITLGQQENAKLRGQFLQMESGANKVVVARGNRETKSLDDATLSIISGIQPDALTPFVQAALKGDSTNDGLLNRFQIIVLNTTAKSEVADSPFANVSLESMNRFFKALQTADFGFEPHLALNSRKVLFSKEARISYQRWCEKNQILIEANNSNPLLQSHLSKYPSLICKLSLIYQVIISFDADNSTLKPIVSVGAEAFEYAKSTIGYLYSHAGTVFSNDVNALHGLAKLMLQRLLKIEDLTTFTASEIAQKGWYFANRDTPLVETLLKYLESFGLVRSQKNDKTVIWFVNPLARYLDL